MTGAGRVQARVDLPHLPASVQCLALQVEWASPSPGVVTTALNDSPSQGRYDAELRLPTGTPWMESAHLRKDGAQHAVTVRILIHEAGTWRTGWSGTCEGDERGPARCEVHPATASAQEHGTVVFSWDEADGGVDIERLVDTATRQLTETQRATDTAAQIVHATAEGVIDMRGAMERDLEGAAANARVRAVATAALPQAARLLRMPDAPSPTDWAGAIAEIEGTLRDLEAVLAGERLAHHVLVDLSRGARVVGRTLAQVRGAFFEYHTSFAGGAFPLLQAPPTPPAAGTKGQTHPLPPPPLPASLQRGSKLVRSLREEVHFTRSTAWATASGGIYAALLRLSDRYRCTRSLLGQTGEEAEEEGVDEALPDLSSFDVSGGGAQRKAGEARRSQPDPHEEVTRLSLEEASLRQSAHSALSEAAAVMPGARGVVRRVESGAASGAAEEAVAAFRRGSPTQLPASTSPRSLRARAADLLEEAVSADAALRKSQGAVESVAGAMRASRASHRQGEPQGEGELRRSVEQAVEESGVAQPTALAVLMSQRLDDLLAATSEWDPAAAARLVRSVQEGAEEGERVRGSEALSRREREHRRCSLASVSGRLIQWLQQARRDGAGAQDVLAAVADAALRAADATVARSSGPAGSDDVLEGAELLAHCRAPLRRSASEEEDEEEEGGTIVHSLFAHYVRHGVGKGTTVAALLASIGREIGVEETSEPEAFMRRCVAECAFSDQVLLELLALAASPAADGGQPGQDAPDAGSRPSEAVEGGPTGDDMPLAGDEDDTPDPAAWLLCALYAARLLAQRRRRCVARAVAAASVGEGDSGVPEDCSALRLLTAVSPHRLPAVDVGARGATVQPSLAACCEAQTLLDALIEPQGEDAKSPTPQRARLAAKALLGCVGVLQAAWTFLQQQPRPSPATSGPALVTDRVVCAMQAAVFHASWRTLFARVCALGRGSHLERLLQQLHQRAAAAAARAKETRLGEPSQGAATATGAERTATPASQSLVRLQARVRGAVTRLRYGFHSRPSSRALPARESMSDAEQLFVLAHLHLRTATGETPLTLALKRGHAAVAAALVRAGADPWAPLPSGAAKAGATARRMPVAAPQPPSLVQHRDTLRRRRRRAGESVPGLPNWAAASLALQLGPDNGPAVEDADETPRQAAPAHLPGPVVAHLALGDPRMLRALGVLGQPKQSVPVGRRARQSRPRGVREVPVSWLAQAYCRPPGAPHGQRRWAQCLIRALRPRSLLLLAREVEPGRGEGEQPLVRVSAARASWKAGSDSEPPTQWLDPSYHRVRLLRCLDEEPSSREWYARVQRHVGEVMGLPLSEATVRVSAAEAGPSEGSRDDASPREEGSDDKAEPTPLKPGREEPFGQPSEEDGEKGEEAPPASAAPRWEEGEEGDEGDASSAASSHLGAAEAGGASSSLERLSAWLASGDAGHFTESLVLRPVGGTKSVLEAVMSAAGDSLEPLTLRVSAERDNKGGAAVLRVRGALACVPTAVELDEAAEGGNMGGEQAADEWEAGDVEAMEDEAVEAALLSLFKACGSTPQDVHDRLELGSGAPAFASSCARALLSEWGHLNVEHVVRVALAPDVHVEAVLEPGQPAAVEVVGLRDTFPEEEVRVPLDAGSIQEWVRQQGPRWEVVASAQGAPAGGESDDTEPRNPMLRASAVDCIHQLIESGVLSTE